MERREFIAAIGGAAATLPFSAHAADHPKESDQEGQPSGIERYEPTPAISGVPLISFAVVHGGIAYISGITANPEKLGDIKDQTRQITARIDTLLAKAGTDKSKLLAAQIWLTDMRHFAEHNDAWNEWVDPKNSPARVCLLSPQLWRPGMPVEIMVTAAK
ncbi:RidA family protein [Nevskia soli]|uniref:RidA family protein n=1 Tax=Nevskia soli TaxID=418856 RepID=UPI000A026C30|nr:RidA family protein [Nevskia soli]